MISLQLLIQYDSMTSHAPEVSSETELTWPKWHILPSTATHKILPTARRGFRHHEPAVFGSRGLLTSQSAVNA